MKYSQFMNCYKEIWLQVLSTLISPVDEHQGGLFSTRTLPAGLMQQASIIYILLNSLYSRFFFFKERPDFNV